jgi:hypothetical protein
MTIEIFRALGITITRFAVSCGCVSIMLWKTFITFPAASISDACFALSGQMIAIVWLSDVSIWSTITGRTESARNERVTEISVRTYFTSFSSISFGTLQTYIACFAVGLIATGWRKII